MGDDKGFSKYAGLNDFFHSARAGEPCRICKKPIPDANFSYWHSTQKDWVCKSCTEYEIKRMSKGIADLQQQLSGK